MGQPSGDYQPGVARRPNLDPIPLPEHRKHKQYEPYIAGDGLLWGPNACIRCDKFRAYDGFSCPVELADNYCWGHEKEDAIEPFRSALQRLVDLKDGPRDDAYRDAKDDAWERARAVLRGAPSASSREVDQ